MPITNAEKSTFAELMAPDPTTAQRFLTHLHEKEWGKDRTSACKQLLRTWFLFHPADRSESNRFWDPTLIGFLLHYMKFSTHEIATCLGVGTVTVERYIEQNPPLDRFEGASHQATTKDAPLSFTWNGKPIAEKPTRTGFRKAMMGLLLVCIATLLAVVFQVFFGKSTVQNSLIHQIATQEPRLLLENGTREEVAEKLKSELGFSADVPTLAGEANIGLGRTTVDGLPPLATFLLGRTGLSRIRIVAIGYQYLDKVTENGLSSNVLSGLAEKEGRPMLLDRQWNQQGCVIWRWRDDLYFAFLPPNQVKTFIGQLSRF